MTLPIEYHVRHASADDLDACLQLRKLTEQCFRNAGLDQWHDSDEGERVIRKWIDLDAMHVVTTKAGDIVACFALSGADQDFWTPPEGVQPALYAYKMMIRPDRRGTGLGDLLLDWMCNRAYQVGARWLRIDCWQTNTQLHAYFERRGFHHYDTRTAAGRNSGWLAERDVAVRTGNSAESGITLVDDTVPAWASFAAKPKGTDRYDPHGHAALWDQAAYELLHADLNGLSHEQRSTAETVLNQLSLKFARLSSETRQANGAYYRVLNGSTA